MLIETEQYYDFIKNTYFQKKVSFNKNNIHKTKIYSYIFSFFFIIGIILKEIGKIIF